VQSSHSCCHFCFVSSFIFVIKVLIGSLLYAILALLSFAASFASLSAVSFPTIPACALTHDSSMLQCARSRLVIFFLISSMRWLWFLVFLIKSIEILLSVNMVAVRGVVSVMIIFSVSSKALVIASCSAWLLEHLLSSLNFSWSTSFVPINSQDCGCSNAQQSAGSGLWM
jgi:hypothetical protein